MKKKGFTLIELLGVITVLGILALVVFPLLLKQINNAKLGIKDANDILILDAAKDYVADNEKEFVKNDGNSYCISLDTLIERNYLNPNLKEPENTDLNLKRVVEIKYEKNVFSYKIVENKTCKNINIEATTDYPTITDNNPGIICGDKLEEDYDNQSFCYIKSIEDLVAFSNLVNSGKNFSSKTVVLENDLNFKHSGSYATSDQAAAGELARTLTAGNGFTPIGNSSSITFKGTFDGNDKKIGSLYISNTTTNNMGLFGYLNGGTIKDLQLESFVVRGKDYVGGIVGYNASGNVKNIISTNGNTYGNSNVGGMIGYNKGILSSCTFTGDVDGNGNVALAVGTNENLTTSIIVEGNVTGTSTAAGIVGKNTKEVRGLITGGTVKCINCTAYRTIGTGANDTSVTLAVDTVITNGGIPTSSLGTTSANGYSVSKDLLDDVNAYERAIDTRIGGDNDSDGYYLDYSENNKIAFIKIEDKPINFTLEGSGTEENPYLIVTAEDLFQVSLNNTAYYKLMANIDFNDKPFYMLSSSNYNKFTGVFDGNNYTISNAKFKGSSKAGLFGDSSGTIKNINLSNIDVEGMGYIGTILGYNSGTVSNVSDSNSKVNAKFDYSGLIGYISTGLVQDIKITNLTNNNQTGYAGGLTGYVGDSAIIKGAEINNLKLTSNGIYTGGITGYNNGTISSIFVNDANVQGTERVGLAVGDNRKTTTSIIVNGAVTGNTYTGGIVGYSEGTLNAVLTNGNITCTSSCYRIGSISGDTKNVIANREVILNGNIVNQMGDPQSSTGLSVENDWLTDINLYEYSIDTRIGGDNDSDGYYLDYDVNKNLKFMKIEDKPINFTLEGEGTAESPYLITNSNELYQVSLNPSAHYKLMNDINLNGENQYTLSSNQNTFSGVFDGNKKTISSLNIKGSRFAGLFGRTAGATIQDLNIKDFNILGSSHVGALVGSNTSSSAVKGIHATNVNTTGYYYVGALVGYNSATITSSIVSGSATGDFVEKKYIGLVTGRNSGTIEAIASGNVSGGTYASGISGYSENKNINAAYTSGTVTGSSRIVDGEPANAIVADNVMLNGSIPTSATSLSSLNGFAVPEDHFNDINTYESVIDTYIGGDNNNDGFYLDYDEEGNLKYVNIIDKPIVFNLIGEGTTENPYQITTKEELFQVSLKQSAVFELKNNIDLTGYNQYMLSSNQNKFTGTFNGNNNTIIGMGIKGSDYTGLFGYNDRGIIKNIKLENVNLESVRNVGSIVGYSNYGTESFIDITNLNVSGKDFVGGVIGNMSESTADNIIYRQNYTLKNIKIYGENEHVAGAIAYNDDYNSISNVIIEGNNEIIGKNYVGLAVGENDLNAQALSLIVEGNVSGNTFVGGIVGYNYRGIVKGAYKNGSVLGTGNYVYRTGYNNTATTQVIANKDITVNGTKIASTTLDSSNGESIAGDLFDNINTYEYTIDTYIGGDNNNDGYYLDYDNNNNLVFIEVKEETPLTGSGTIEDPYLIYTKEDMKKASLNPSLNYKLMADIDYTNENFYELGSYQNVFKGTFDGNNHTISNITTKGSSYSGFIGYNTGTVKNVNLNNFNLKAENNIGFVGCNQGTVQGINIENVTLEGNNNIGTITGKNSGGSIKGIQSITESTDNNVIGNEHVGGLLGYNTDISGSIISDGIFKGNVTGYKYVGLGVGENDSNAQALSLIVEGNVSGNNFVGGLIGQNYRGTVKGAYKNGSVLGTGNYVYRTGYNNTATTQVIANKDITVNGTKIASTTLDSSNGESIAGDLFDNINTYEYTIDTYIGGDNNNDGYYLDYDNNNNLVFIEVKEETPLTGSGTIEDPYLIYTKEDMKKASLNPSLNYKLMADIDYTNENFYELGSYQNVFKGTFDGNNQTISNITTKGSSCAGFIGYNSGIVKNINLNNFNLKGENNIGFVGYNKGTVQGINLKNAIVQGYIKVGTISGTNNEGTIKGIQSVTDSTEYNIIGNEYVGGLLGYNANMSGSIMSVGIFKGNVSGNKYVGLGIGENDSNAQALSLIVEGNVSGTNFVGGLVGQNYKGTVKGVYVNGSVTGTENYVYRAGYDSSATTQVIANKDITVKGKTTSSTTLDSSSGLDSTLEELTTTTPYETLGFNLTNTDPNTKQYIWYFEDNTLKFKAN